MHKESGDPPLGSGRRLERAIVLVLLSEDDGERQWSRAELCEGMGVERGELASALGGLLEAGVLHGEQDHIWPSPAARRLDELALVSI